MSTDRKSSNVIRDDFVTGPFPGTSGNDHIIHHRDPSVGGHSGTGLIGFAGDDTLEASVPDGGQIHMYAGPGNDYLILDVTKIPNATGHQGHHVYGGPGHNTFDFVNVAQNNSPIVGRIDDFDPTSDTIMIEGREIDLFRLPEKINLPGGLEVEVRVIEVEHPEFREEALGAQYFLAIGDNIFYALEGARDLKNGQTGSIGEERHFVLPNAIDEYRNAESVQYENPKNFVPIDFYEHRIPELQMYFAPEGKTITIAPDNAAAAIFFGGKRNFESDSSKGAQEIIGSHGGDVINGNTGNNTIYGGAGDDLIAGGIDDDIIFGGDGDDLIWGGDGDDMLFGGGGDDYLFGGRGDDYLNGGEGNDTLDGGRGDNTLTGGGGDESVNRFHFSSDEGQNYITDFRPDVDLITFEDTIHPMSVEIFENDHGNTVINYGERGSVELKYVSLDEFKLHAGERRDLDDPIISITPSPERELLQQKMDENGHSENGFELHKVPDAMYGVEAFSTSDPGGYFYVSEITAEEQDEIDDYYQEREQPESAPGLLIEQPRMDTENEESEDEVENDHSISRGGDGSCFVATAAYKDPWHPDVIFLRSFRDHWLSHRRFGRILIRVYWRVGPLLAKPVRQHPALSVISRFILRQVVFFIRSIWRA